MYQIQRMHKREGPIECSIDIYAISDTCIFDAHVAKYQSDANQDHAENDWCNCDERKCVGAAT